MYDHSNFIHFCSDSMQSLVSTGMLTDIYWDASVYIHFIDGITDLKDYDLEGFTCCFLVNHLNVRWIMLCIGSARCCNGDLSKNQY